MNSIESKLGVKGKRQLSLKLCFLKKIKTFTKDKKYPKKKMESVLI